VIGYGIPVFTTVVTAALRRIATFDIIVILQN
jgi:hypothetical protein